MLCRLYHARFAVSIPFVGVYAVVARIPEGKVTTYGAIARIVVVPRGARGVGWLMARCPSTIPWWRVVSASGRITSPEVRLQEEILRSEGVIMRATGLVEMTTAFWQPILD